MSGLMGKVTMRTRCVCNTWHGSLDDDLNHSFGWFLVEDAREFTCCLEFLPVLVPECRQNSDDLSVLMSILKSSTVSLEGVDRECVGLGFPSTRQNRSMWLSVMELRSIGGKQAEGKSKRRRGKKVRVERMKVKHERKERWKERRRKMKAREQRLGQGSRHSASFRARYWLLGQGLYSSCWSLWTGWRHQEGWVRSRGNTCAYSDSRTKTAGPCPLGDPLGAKDHVPGVHDDRK